MANQHSTNEPLNNHTSGQLSRRSFLALSAAVPFALRYPLAAPAKGIPIGK